MTEIQWQEPPAKPAGPGAGGYRKFRDALVSNPGRWAVYPSATVSRSTAYNIKKGQGVWSPARAFDAVSRKNDAGDLVTYVRYVGEQQPAEVTA